MPLRTNSREKTTGTRTRGLAPLTRAGAHPAKYIARRVSSREGGGHTVHANRKPGALSRRKGARRCYAIVNFRPGAGETPRSYLQKPPVIRSLGSVELSGRIEAGPIGSARERGGKGKAGTKMRMGMRERADGREGARDLSRWLR